MSERLRPDVTPQRYKLLSDDEGHSYVVPVAKEQAFSEWLKAAPYREGYEGEDFNDYRLDGCPTLITFTDPREDG